MIQQPKLSNQSIREPSLQMRAVLTVIAADRDLIRVSLAHIDRSNEAINWDNIFKQHLSSGQRGALLIAYALWTDEVKRGFALFDLALNMEVDLKCACLRALALRWGVGANLSNQVQENQESKLNLTSKELQ